MSYIVCGEEKRGRIIQGPEHVRTKLEDAFRVAAGLLGVGGYPRVRVTHMTSGKSYVIKCAKAKKQEGNGDV